MLETFSWKVICNLQQQNISVFFWKLKLVSDLPFATQQIFLSFLNQSWLIQTSLLHLWECMCLKVSKYFMPLYIWTQKTIYLNKILENAWKDQFCGLFRSRWNQRYSKIMCWSLRLSVVEIKEAKYGLKSNQTLTCFGPFLKKWKIIQKVSCTENFLYT